MNETIGIAVMIGVVALMVGASMRSSYYTSTKNRGTLILLIGVLLIGGGLYKAVSLQVS